MVGATAAAMTSGLLGVGHAASADVIALSDGTDDSTAKDGTRIVPAEAPLPGGQVLSNTAAQNRLTDQRATRARERQAELARPKWIRPGTGYLSSRYGPRWGTTHNGIDLAAPYGAPIYAAGDGVVIEAGSASGFGNWVVIQHANGDVTIYGHMRRYLVEEGERVQAGQLIALVASEGQSTGPHLHFEVRENGMDGTPIDPIEWMADRGVRI